MTARDLRSADVGLPHDETSRLAGRLREWQERMADRLTEEWFLAHPEDLARFGPSGRVRTRDDFRYHLAFLATAIEFGSVTSFESYLTWTAGVLDSRGVGPWVLRQSLDRIAAVLATTLDSASRQVLDRFVAAGRCALAEYLVPSDVPATGDHAQSVFLQAVLAGERHAALAVARNCLAAGRAIEDVYLSVVQETLRAVGRLWEANRITVADEHLATAVVQYVLALLYEQLPASRERRGKMVMTGVEGEFHQVGAHIVADLLEADGWDVRFLGANVPAPAILEHVRSHGAAVVGISATMLVSLPAVRRLVEALTGLQARRPFIIVRGAAFGAIETAWREVGADAFAPDPLAARILLRDAGASLSPHEDDR
jgi:MerR family transcriptional regulator, light-induced transcriptional regulator